jgi:hypothetical protein
MMNLNNNMESYQINKVTKHSKKFKLMKSKTKLQMIHNQMINNNSNKNKKKILI